MFNDISIEILTLQPNDLVILRYSNDSNLDDLQRLLEILQDALPFEVRVIAIENNISIRKIPLEEK